MKGKFLKTITATLLMAFSVLGVAGCNNANSSTDNGITTVKFFGWGKAPEQRNFQKMVNAFMEDNPDVKVVYECVDPTNYDTALQNRIKSLQCV